MKIQDVRNIAKQHNIKSGGQSKTELIRKIQLHEGNLDCFATASYSECDQLGCLWRDACVVGTAE